MSSFRIISITVLILMSYILSGQSIVNTPHDLSSGGSSTIRADTEDLVCIFCHTPHSSRPVAPLWNKNDPGASYTLYSSSTLEASSNQPDGSSILCLSCHDGTIALGDVVNRGTDIVMTGGITTMPIGDTNLETDLSDDHPVSYNYTSAIASSDGQLLDPASIGPNIILEGGKIQCTSCHDPHENTFTKFLVASNENSALCTSCHNLTDWSGSAHQGSGATWNGSGDDPWAHVDNPYPTVQQNACQNCHDPHNSGESLRLLKGAVFEDNCVDCHDGSVASADIRSDMIKAYTHGGYAYSLHDPNESVSPTTQHVVCVDCHSPHTLTAGNPLQGIPGIDIGGSPVTTITSEYELCFRCHSGGNAFPPSPTPRQLGSNDVRVDFQGSVSSHPVLTPSDGNGRGLLPPYDQPGVIILCSDCHASNDSGLGGPHGSIYPRILKANYNMAEATNLQNHNDATLATEFALCAQCHDMTAVNTIHSTMKGGHFLGYTTCNTCHDPHGFSGGNATNNSYLINFSTSPTAIGPNREGSFEVTMNLDGTGSCSFECHAKSKNHRNSSGNY